MAAAFFVVDILANDFPVWQVEDFLAKDFVGVGESVQDESFKQKELGLMRYWWVWDGWVEHTDE